MNSRYWIFFRSILAAWCITSTLYGQQSGSTTEQASPATALPGDGSSAILQSREWQQLESRFHEWLSVQAIYTPDEIEGMKSQLRQQIASMSSGELRDFMNDAHERMDLLLSQQAFEARAWLNLLTPAAQRQAISQGDPIPNVFEMSTSQLRQELIEFQNRRQQRRAARAELRRAQDEQVAQVQRARQSQQRAVAASQRRAGTFGPPQSSPLAPRSPHAPSQSVFVRPWGGVGRGGW